MVTILYEDEDILVVKKPAGQESQSGRGFSMDLLSEIKNELARREKRANPYVAVVHRLDRPVSGVMVYAKTKAAAAALSRQVGQGTMKKRYYALLTRPIVPSSGTLEHMLVHDQKTNCSHVAQIGESGAKKAVLHYRAADGRHFHEFDAMAKDGTFPMVDIELVTGRHHQIRVQFAAMGCPLVGDTKYGNSVQTVGRGSRIALCAYQLTFQHPRTGRTLTFTYEGQ